MRLTIPVALALIVGASLPAQRRSYHGSLDRWRALVQAACDETAPVGDSAAKFGRGLPVGPDNVDADALFALAEAMRESRSGKSPAELEDPTLPAGIIFLGQFIDHDITLDVLSQLGEATDPGAIENFRSPRFDLDSCYRDGPEASPYLYDRDRWGHFLIGSPDNPLDLARNGQGTALIGDPRNDENGVVSQLQLLFLRFHNAVMAEVERGRVQQGRYDGESEFEYARRMVQWHYQWIVHHEYLPAVVSPQALAAVESMIENDHEWCQAPVLPVEFSVAAYRFGHSQVRSTYRVAPGRPDVDLFRPPVDALASFEPVPSRDVLDFDFFFAVDGSQPQSAQRIDPFIADEVYELPFASHRSDRDRSLAFRNLQRGANTYQLASGEQAAQFFGVDALPTHPAVTAAGLDHTPLWFYCLQEADANDGRLGAVGGRIVGMALLRMLRDDDDSYLQGEAATEFATARAARVPRAADYRQSQRRLVRRAVQDRQAWQPFLGAETGEFGMADVIRFVRGAR